MKKFLSLVLALVMTMSLVTVAGAKDFTDDSEITYKEAVDVMTSAGIVGGYADGSFGPTATLTRGAAAKIICNMILGPTTAEALSADTAPYKDVPADHTFAGYIAYCANKGIISGYADGTFRPAATLTGYAFMKMLLGALGYDAEVEGYTGANWSIQVAKKALNLGLDDGLKGKFVGTKALTREEACLYAFNTLNTKMVEYDNQSTIVVGDITIKNNSVAKETTLFRTEYFEDLKKVSSDGDDFGRPAHTWKNGKTEIGTYADDADYIVVLDDAYTGLNDKDLLDFVQDETANDDLTIASAKTTFNGDPKAAVKYEAGTVLELYCNDEDDEAKKYEADENKVTEIIAYAYELVQIDSVSTKVSSTAAKQNAEYMIKLVDTDGKSVGTYYDEYKDDDSKVLTGFNAKTYTEDTYIAIVKGSKGIIDSYVAEVVEGELDAYKASSYIQLDGTKYYLANGMKLPELDFDEDYTAYLTKDGYVLFVDGETGTTIDDVYYVTYVDSDTKKGDTTYTAETVSLKGEVKDVEITDAAYKILGDGATGAGLYTLDWNDDDDAYDVKAFTKDDDYTVTSATAFASDIKSDASSVTLGKKVYLSNDTQYVSIKTTKSGAVKEVKAAEGGMAYSGKNAATVIALYDSDKDAAYVLYVGTEMSSTVATDNVVFVVDKSDDVVAKNVYNTEVWFMDGVLNDTVEVKGQEDVGFYTYAINSDGYYELTGMTKDKVTGKVDDDTTGWSYINFVGTDIHNTTVSFSGTAIYDDAEFGAAEVIDLRDDDTIEAATYDYEITSVADLVDAADEMTVNAYVYIEDGEIIFIAVK